MTEYLADVSEFQLDVDWPAYGAAYHGVIIRAHNGSRPDNYWLRNRDGARANVMWRGFYQYLPASVNPVAAARAFQATTGPLLPGEVAILDLEEGTGDQRARRQAWLDALQDPVEWTYSGLAFARAHLPGVGVEWIAAYGQSEPTVPHALWQFTNARTFAGISKPCDGSIFHGTITAGLSGGLGRSIGGGAPVLTPTGSTPAPTPAPVQEAPDMISVLHIETGRTYTAAPGFLKHHSNPEEGALNLLMCRQTEQLAVHDDDMRRVLWNLGLPGNGDGRDPLVILAALPVGGELVAGPPVTVTAAPAVVDYAAVAKAVNDDAAQRLAS